MRLRVCIVVKVYAHQWCGNLSSLHWALGQCISVGFVLGAARSCHMCSTVAIRCLFGNPTSFSYRCLVSLTHFAAVEYVNTKWWHAFFIFNVSLSWDAWAEKFVLQAGITHFLLKGISNARQFLGKETWHDGVAVPVPLVLSSAQGVKLLFFLFCSKNIELR